MNTQNTNFRGIQKGLVSTIIPVYNRPELLKDAVMSVVAQRYRPIEIIIVDDGSTDSTAAVAMEFNKQYDFLKVLSIANSGVGLARQAGLDIATGEFIQYLDSDDLLHANKFKKQVAGLLCTPEAGVSYCVQRLCSEQGELLEEPWMRSAEEHSSMFPAMLAGRLWGTPVPLYRHSLLTQIGPWLALSSEEDWEYDCRLARLGIELHHCPETLVTVRVHSGDHLGQLDKSIESKLHDRSEAYQHIYQHALNAKLEYSQSEFKHFNRMMFSLARSCAELGLVSDAKQLLTLSKESSSSLKASFEYHIYSILSNIFSWPEFAKFSKKIRGVKP